MDRFINIHLIEYTKKCYLTEAIFILNHSIITELDKGNNVTATSWDFCKAFN